MVEALPAEDLPVVVVTGLTGYVGSWTALLAVKSGKYHVRGTVRSKSNAEKLEPLKKSMGQYYD